LNSCFLIPAACLLIPGFTGCSPQKKITAPQDKPLAAFQTNLLQTAFDFATAIPVVPHIKDRSKMQASAATTCFQLNQPQRALGYIEKIGDWRRGAGYADYAFYCAQKGFINEVQNYLNLAEQVAVVADQDWRRDRIKVRIAQTHRILGQEMLSEKFSADLEKSETGKAEQTEAAMCETDDFQRQIDDLEKIIAIADFDQTKNALYALAELFSRFYEDVDRRRAAEEKIKSLWSPMPLFIRIELLGKLADFAIRHHDLPKALELTNEGQAIADGAQWPVEYRIPLMARLAALRFRSGEPVQARESLRLAAEFYTTKQAEIIDIDRAEALIPVAEAFQTVGDTPSALSIYKQAVEAAVVNPNNRPRAEDICAICLSMVLNNVEPDAALWKRIREIQANLGDPW
jgi:hypothetical protein